MRDLESQYVRSLIGRLWMLLTPLCLLGMYAIVFGKFFGVKWHQPLVGGGSEDIGFVLPFFVGLTIYLFFSDIINSSTSLFSNKRSYVLKSAFPIWVLWLSNIIRATITASVSMILVIALSLLQGRFGVDSILWVLITTIVVMFFSLSISLILSSLGPFIGDISEFMRLLLRVLFYASPITYPLTLIPETYQAIMWLNPLTSMVELYRAPIVFGMMPSIKILLIFSGVSTLLSFLAFYLFNKVKVFIPDVV
jgi:lipopolysaccharide transport system permease protein